MNKHIEEGYQENSTERFFFLALNTYLYSMYVCMYESNPKEMVLANNNIILRAQQWQIVI